MKDQNRPSTFKTRQHIYLLGSSATVQQSFQVAEALQRISFEELSPNKTVLAKDAFRWLRSSPPACRRAVVSHSFICSFEPAEVHVMGAGICTIDANWSGSAYYEEAPSLSRPQVSG